MWLVQLHKANDNSPIDNDVYFTNNCEANYIAPDPYLNYVLNLCDAWNYDTRSLLILNKNAERTIIRQLQNERFMNYFFNTWYHASYIRRNIIYLEYLENEDFFIDFYVFTDLYLRFNIPYDILYASNIELALLRYIKGKTLNIGILGSETPKYSIEFDNNCKYYSIRDDDSISIWVIKNPFCIHFSLQRGHTNLYMTIWIKPRLIEDFNNYAQNTSNHNPRDDQPLKINEIIDSYFDTNAKTGLLYDDVDIDDDDDNFRYSVIRVLLEVFKSEIGSYYFKFDNEIGSIQGLPSSINPPLNELSVCIYFPLFRPQIDNNGVTRPKPQYDPNDTSSYVDSFQMYINLRGNGEVDSCSLWMTYGNGLSSPINCTTYVSGYVPSWRFDSCDLTLPFRFASSIDCDGTDAWDDQTRMHNSNYLFRIVKHPLSGLYSIKGIGCGELTQNINSFGSFSSIYPPSNFIAASTVERIQRIAFSERGYTIETISSTLANSEARNSKTCFVLFNESLIENTADFLSIYQAVTSALPNSIVCYIGSSEKVPNTHRNKVIQSNAIVTDLDTNEQMPLVIKYIRYAERIHKLFNR